jgi:hypothetical protein
MSKRYVTFGFTVLMALALAVPALGGPTNPVARASASASSTAKKALKAAKKAQTTANSAQTTANSASKAAAAAQTSANSASSAAGSANSAASAASSAAAAANANANTRLKTTSSVTTSGTNGTSHITGVACPSGTEVTGGGYGLGGTSPQSAIVTSNRDYGNGWIAIAEEVDGGTSNTWSTDATAICASP